jgi:phenylpyruvate tautomerase PptA (4-oxalocrotonate tautomerase family)
MPMLDAYIPDGALTDAAEEQLVADLTDVLLRWEGADPSSELARSIAWVFVHRPGRVLVGGRTPTGPHYKVVVSVPEGQLDDERRAGMVGAVTEAVLRAEGSDDPDGAARIWVFTTEVPDGTWSAGGRIRRLADIATFVLGGDREAGARHAAAMLGPTSPAPA